MLKDIEEERLKLQEQRARCEMAKTLQSKNADDTGRSRAEIDAAVKYAEVNKILKIYFYLSSFFEVNSMGKLDIKNIAINLSKRRYSFERVLL